jgi:NAD-dependent deacetylase
LRFRRAAEGSDVDAVVRLVESAYRGDASRAGWTTEADFLEGQRTDAEEVSGLVRGFPRSRILLAEEDGALLGCVRVDDEGDAGYVGMFAVVPSLQGRGLGAALLAEAERVIRDELGRTRARMTVISIREPLIAWYERKGYARTGETERFPYGDPRFGVPLRDDLEFVLLEKQLRAQPDRMDDRIARLAALCAEARAGSGPVVFLTGAGISAESGIPTFRGPEGYWQVGSRNYRAEDLATYDAFTRMPEEVWAWYLYRRGVCRAAPPNAAHRALVDAEARLGDRFLLVTQNVDGLHLRAGNTPARTYEVHGNIDYLRCGDEHPVTRLLPDGIPLDWGKDRKLAAAEVALLRGCRGGAWSRPHVLFFDESYDEPLFRFESSLRAARTGSMLVVVGTSAATNLPTQMVSIAVRRGIPLVCINLDPSPFTQATEASERGLVLLGTAGEWVPRVVEALAGR